MKSGYPDKIPAMPMWDVRPILSQGLIQKVKSPNVSWNWLPGMVYFGMTEHILRN